MLRLPFILLLTAASCEATTGGDPDGEGEGEVCGAVRCPVGYACVDGACLPADGCGEIVCDRGFVCSRGRCEAFGTDGDGDGALIEDDCDDADPEILPGTEIECSTYCGSGTRTCAAGIWTACTAPTECEPDPDAGPDPDPDAGPDPDPDAGPDPDPDPCDICDPEHHVALANGEPCDCDERWRVVFAEEHGASVSQVCRDGTWQAYNLNPSDPAACCAGDFAGCNAG
jgi:hypothetical protein